MFDDLPNKSTIISKIQDMPISARTIERRITGIVKDVNKQHTIALQTTKVFSVALDESVDINNNPRFAIVARYCCDGEVHEELCSLKPKYGTTIDYLIYFKMVSACLYCMWCEATGISYLIG